MNIFKSIMAWLFGAGKAQSNGSLSSRLYVGNINFSTKETEIQDLFSKYGRVISVSIIRNRFTGRPKGYAFVEMAGGPEASKALELSGTDFGGRKIVVSQAKEKKSGQDRDSSRKREGGRGGRSRGKRRGGSGSGGSGSGGSGGGRPPRGKSRDREEVRDDRAHGKKMERWEEEDHSNYE